MFKAGRPGGCAPVDCLPTVTAVLCSVRCAVPHLLCCLASWWWGPVRSLAGWRYVHNQAHTACRAGAQSAVLPGLGCLTGCDRL